MCGDQENALSEEFSRVDGWSLPAASYNRYLGVEVTSSGTWSQAAES
jgi:hypothetical protein